MKYFRIQPVFAIVCLLVAAPGAAVAQKHHESPTQRAANAEASANMRSRIAAAIDRVTVTEQHGKISAARAVAVRGNLVRAQSEMAAFKRRQGFVSAAQLASYGRLVVAVDAELGAGASGHASTNGNRPSTEQVAFQRTHARLNYRNARIEYDAENCAFYEGVTNRGPVRREPLKDSAGRKICPRR